MFAVQTREKNKKERFVRIFSHSKIGSQRLRSLFWPKRLLKISYQGGDAFTCPRRVLYQYEVSSNFIPHLFPTFANLLHFALSMPWTMILLLLFVVVISAAKGQDEQVGFDGDILWSFRLSKTFLTRSSSPVFGSKTFTTMGSSVTRELLLLYSYSFF